MDEGGGGEEKKVGARDDGGGGEGAKRIGEFGVGTNYGINRYCYDLLFDEKIGGTAHIALGRAYEQCGGINQSAFHWDLIKDLREEGQLILDGKVVMQNGTFLI